MPDIWMDVDAALSEVPVNLVALIDDTDFKSREESVTFDQAGLDLLWNFTTTAGVFTQTAVTPTDTAGDYDWLNQGNGYYTIEIPASSGASINNNAEGFGFFSGFATGILPWRGPVIGFRAAAVNNDLIDAGSSLAKASVATEARLAELDAANMPSDLADTLANTITIEGQTDDIGVAGAGLTDVGGMSTGMKAEVASEVSDELEAPIPELGVAQPTATPSVRTGLMLLYMGVRNQFITQTSGVDAAEFYNSAGTIICHKVLTDDGADYTEAKMVSG